MPSTFLLKTEPNEYSYADLAGDGSCVWEGVANPQARAILRTIRAGDSALIYHTGNDKAIVGLAKVTRGAFEDPSNPGLTKDGAIAAPVIELKPVRAARTPVTLAMVKADPRFRDFGRVKQSRLSVMAVPPDLDKALRDLAGL